MSFEFRPETCPFRNVTHIRVYNLPERLKWICRMCGQEGKILPSIPIPQRIKLLYTDLKILVDERKVEDEKVEA